MGDILIKWSGTFEQKFKRSEQTNYVNNFKKSIQVEGKPSANTLTHEQVWHILEMQKAVVAAGQRWRVRVAGNEEEDEAQIWSWKGSGMKWEPLGSFQSSEHSSSTLRALESSVF